MRLKSAAILVGAACVAAVLAYQFWPRGATQTAQTQSSTPAPGAGGQRPAGTPGGGSGSGPGGGQPPVVEVLPVATGTITEIAEAVGTTRAFESVAIASKLSGVVDSISFEEGANVTAGQQLLGIDSAERRADLEAAKAAVQQEIAKRNELRTRLDRAIQLRRTGAGTEALVDDLTAQVKTADTAVQTAMARERASAARLDDATVRAPFSGRVGIRQVSLGAFLDSRTTITTLDDISRLRLDFQIPEGLLSRLAVGAKVSAMGAAFGSRRFEGEVVVIDTRIDPATRSIRLTALIPNTDLVLRPGMFMSVSLQVAQRENALLIPEEAIVGEGPLQLVFVVAENRVQRRIVKTGQRESGKVEITEGLKAGEQIVVRGVQRVRGGITVNARPAGSAASPAGPQAAAPSPQQNPRP